MEDILAIIFIFGGGALILLAFSPVGRALADRIRGRLPGATGGDASVEIAELRDELTAEIETMRHEMGEFAERLDFTERMLAKQKDAERLGPGSVK
ncbi:MAG TPA: hypothetical protein VNG95_01015 [Gemmatimonadales bacterium]|nr:hypothetical protein [Gemmatimonadales bacterium]